MVTIGGEVWAPLSRDAQHRIAGYLDRVPDTPCLIIDLPTVGRRFALFRELLPEARILYAVKANPAPEIVRLLAGLGAEFDVASLPEVELCLRQGVPPDRLSYTNTIKKRADVAAAYALGVRTFAFDSAHDLERIAAVAPGSSVLCRLLVDNAGAVDPLGAKFGCSPEMAADLLVRADRSGLDARGVSFHVGSQQLDPAAWEAAIARCARVAGALAGRGAALRLLDLGGGFPVGYREPVPPMSRFAETIRAAVARHFPADPPRLAMEPGRAIVAHAGVVFTEVVLIARKSYDDAHRWVYLDVGRYNGGLADTDGDGQAAVYPVRAARDGPYGPVALAGPTCDGEDVLRHPGTCRLPLDLRAGDRLALLGAGAYTASRAQAGFNGFPPVPTHCVGGDGGPGAITPFAAD